MAKRQAHTTENLLEQLANLDVERAKLIAQINQSQPTYVNSLRSAYGMSQSAFAAAADVSQPFVSQVESGVRVMSVEKLGEITRRLHTEGDISGNQD